jgi:hypothetical protein
MRTDGQAAEWQGMTSGKNSHGELWWIALFVGLMVLPWLLLAGWMGMTPIVTTLMGARTPQNLGVSYAPADLQKFEAKTGIVVAPRSAPEAAAPPTPTLAAPGPNTKPLDLNLTQEEVSAVLNQAGAGLLPLRNVQVKLGAGAAEISGALDTARLGDFLKSVGVRDKNIQRIAGWTRAFGDQIPVYLKATGGVQDAQLNLQVNALRLGNIEIPQEQIQRYTGDGLHSNLKGNERFAVQELTLQEGALRFVGALPKNLGRGSP